MSECIRRIDPPYGDGIVSIDLPAGPRADVYRPKDMPGAADPEAEVFRAMNEPIRTLPLAGLASGKRRGRHGYPIVFPEKRSLRSAGSQTAPLALGSVSP